MSGAFAAVMMVSFGSSRRILPRTATELSARSSIDASQDLHGGRARVKRISLRPWFFPNMNSESSVDVDGISNHGVCEPIILESSSYHVQRVLLSER